MRAITLREYALEPEVRYVLLVLLYVILVNATIARRHLYEFTVVELHTELRGKHLSQPVAAASELTRYGHHNVLTGSHGLGSSLA